MSLEVANLVARYSVEIDGARQAINEMRQFTDAARQAGTVSAQSADRFDDLAESTERVVASQAKAVRRVFDVTNEIRKQGVTAREAAQEVAQWDQRIADAARQVDQLRAAGIEPPQELFNLSEGILPPGVRERVEQFRDLLDELNTALGQADAASSRTNRSLRRLGNGFARVQGEVKANQQPLRTFLRQLLSINNGSIFTSYGIASLVGRLTGLGLVAAGIIRGFQKLIQRFREGADAVDAFTRADDGLARMVRDFEDLENVDLGKLVGQLEDIRIRLSNLGAVDDVLGAERLLEIAVDFQFLNATPDDLDRTLQQLFRTVQSLDFSGLAEFDLGTPGLIEDLNRKYQELADQGLSQATLRQMAFLDLQQIATQQAGVAAQREADEQKTLAYQLGQMEGLWRNVVVENESFQESVAGVVASIQRAQPALEWLVDFFGNTLGRAVKLGIDAIEGFQLIWNSLVNVLAGGTAILEEILTLGFGDTSDLQAIADEAARANDRLLALRKARTQFAEQGVDAADAYANVLAHVADQASLNIAFFEQLRQVTGATTGETRDAIQAVLDQADAWGFDASQVKLMRDQLDAYATETSNAGDATVDFVGSTTDALASLKRELDNVGEGRRFTDVLAKIGEASLALRESPDDARAALAFFDAYQDGIAAALNGGAEKIAAFREFVEEQLRPQLSTQEYETIIGVIQDVEGAFGPLAASAERFKGEADTAAGTVATYGDNAATAAGQTNELQGAVEGAHGALMDLSNGGPYTVDIVARWTQELASAPLDTPSGGARPPVRASEPPSSTPFAGVDRAITQFQQLDRDAAVARGETVPRPPPPDVGEGVSSRELADFNKALREATSSTRNLSTNQEAAVRDAIDQQNTLRQEARLREATENLFRTVGGGGGGGGGGSDLMDIEEVRAFMQEVNRAIAIASRGGVRIGTAGNAIPFEPGSFINTEGNQISIDTILIRGVWDYTDPATRRQIVKELQEALQDLQGEL